jgi:superfamily II DNA or RNA helicase
MGRHVILLAHRREIATMYFENIQFEDKILRLGSESKSKKAKAIRDRHYQLVVATFQFMNLAFDMPRLDTIINTGAFSSGNYGNDVKQAVGRILRYHPDKPRPVVIDIYDYYTEPRDDGKQGNGFAYNMYLKRVSHYKSFDYEYAGQYKDIESIINLVKEAL